MASCQTVTAWVAPLALLLLASRSLAQTIPVTISSFGYGQQILLYGQPQTYTANLTVPAGSPVPQGNLLFQNASATISTAPLTTSGTTQGNSLIVSFTDTARADRLAAGIYSAYHAVFPGSNSSGFNWAGTDSRNTPLPDGVFQVLPASVALSYRATPFTLANFTDSLILVATNVNGTNAVPEGPVYEVITSVPSGQQISNDSLILTPTGTNTLTGKLPPSFNATKLLTIGTYQAVFTYYPTSNFTQPFPLVVGFQVVNVTVPAPPPPPGVPPPPPPPPGVVPPPPPKIGTLNTTIVLEVFYEEGKKDWLKHDCSGSALVFTASVRGPTPQQVPSSGTISFQILPSGIVIGSAPVTPDPALGSAYVTIVEPGPQSVGYGQYTVVATYSGSTEGLYLPSRAAAVLELSESCGEHHGDLLHKIGDASTSIVHYVASQTADAIGDHASNDYYGYGNGYDHYGYGNAPYPPYPNGGQNPYSQGAYVGK